MTYYVTVYKISEHCIVQIKVLNYAIEIVSYQLGAVPNTNHEIIYLPN